MAFPAAPSSSLGGCLSPHSLPALVVILFLRPVLPPGCLETTHTDLLCFSLVGKGSWVLFCFNYLLAVCIFHLKIICSIHLPMFFFFLTRFVFNHLLMFILWSSLLDPNIDPLSELQSMIFFSCYVGSLWTQPTVSSQP